MLVIAALGDAGTAAIAVVAIALGLLLAVRGPRERRPADDAQEPGPAMLKVPLSGAREQEPEEPEEPGFVGPEGEVVGHGPIRLGVHGPLGGGEPAGPPEPEPAPAATEPQPAAVQPAPGPAAVQPAPQPAAVQPAPEPAAPEPAPEPTAPKEPAWRSAARAANSAVHFRQGTIKLGGKDAGKHTDQ